MGASRLTIQRIIKGDLGLRPFKRHKIYGLLTQQHRVRLERSKASFWRYVFGIVRRIVIFDEKLLIKDEHLNAQNFRVYAGAFEDIPERTRTVQRFQKPGFGGRVQRGRIFPGSCRIRGDSKCCVAPGGNL